MQALQGKASKLLARTHQVGVLEDKVEKLTEENDSLRNIARQVQGLVNIAL